MKALATVIIVFAAGFVIGNDAGARHVPKAVERRVVVYRDPTPIPVDPRCHGYRLNGVADLRCIPPIPLERNQK